jgi:hypothetical protein
MVDRISHRVLRDVTPRESPARWQFAAATSPHTTGRPCCWASTTVFAKTMLVVARFVPFQRGIVGPASTWFAVRFRHGWPTNGGHLWHMC